MIPRIVMLSMWRNDVGRNLQQRALHLLAKTYPALRWVWVVGDSDDATYWELLAIVNAVNPQRRVDLFRYDTGIAGEGYTERMRRLGETANYWLTRIQPADDYVIVHESDIISPPDLAERFLRHAEAGRCPVAGWPVLGDLFYDTWAYRKDGACFSNTAPYHACYQADRPFPVDSVGTCWMFHAEDARAGARFGAEACLDLCADLRQMGRQFWVDPTLIVTQPVELWHSQPMQP